MNTTNVVLLLVFLASGISFSDGGGCCGGMTTRLLGNKETSAPAQNQPTQAQPNVVKIVITEPKDFDMKIRETDQTSYKATNRLGDIYRMTCYLMPKGTAEGNMFTDGDMIKTRALGVIYDKITEFRSFSYQPIFYIFMTDCKTFKDVTVDSNFLEAKLYDGQWEFCNRRDNTCSYKGPTDCSQFAEDMTWEKLRNGLRA